MLGYVNIIRAPQDQDKVPQGQSPPQGQEIGKYLPLFFFNEKRGKGFSGRK